MLLSDLDEAIKLKDKYNYLVGSVIKPEPTPLLKLIIIQKDPTEFGLLWASQTEEFNEEDLSKSMEDEEFENQLNNLEHADLSKIDDCLYIVIGVFRSIKGVPRFLPLDSILYYNGL